jgi:hypothetical protein
MRVLARTLHGRVLVGVVACVHVLALAQIPEPSSGIYTCIDAKGRKLTSDRPIPECLDREQKVLNPSGTVKARVGPTLTAQERADAEAKEKQEADARALLLEERRRERALLVRYPSRKVHDKERAEALAQVGAVKLAASTRVEDLVKERRKVEEELEFYKKDPGKAPPVLRRQMDDIAQSIAVQKRFLGEQDNEIRRINARFDEELQRLKPLWDAQARMTPGGASTKTKRVP